MEASTQMAPYGRHRRLPRTHYGRTYTIEIPDLVSSPLDMMGLMGMAQVIAAIAMASKASEEARPPGTGPPSMPIRSRKTANKCADGP